MAIITLEPGESFEHYHSHSSKSECLVGSLRASLSGESKILEKNLKIDVPADTAHTITNIGDTLAIFRCEHSLGQEVETDNYG